MDKINEQMDGMEWNGMDGRTEWNGMDGLDGMDEWNGRIERRRPGMDGRMGWNCMDRMGWNGMRWDGME